jgi:hypothetical protein
MRLWLSLVLTALALGGCISRSPSPMVVVVPGSQVVCPNGSTVTSGGTTRC